jgi:hypothetical protein
MARQYDLPSKPKRSLRPLHVGLDLGGTLFNRKAEKADFGEGDAKAHTWPLFFRAKQTLEDLLRRGCKFSVISKIDPGAQDRTLRALIAHGLMGPDCVIVSKRDVHFCFNRADKGDIARQVEIDVLVDDRSECHDAAFRAGVPRGIIYLEEGDDRLVHPLQVARPIAAYNWSDVAALICGFMRLPDGMRT